MFIGSYMIEYPQIHPVVYFSQTLVWFLLLSTPLQMLPLLLSEFLLVLLVLFLICPYKHYFQSPVVSLLFFCLGLLLASQTLSQGLLAASIVFFLLRSHRNFFSHKCSVLAP